MILGAWLGATPNFPQERAQFDVEIWGTVTFLCLAMALVNAVLLYRGAKSRSKGGQHHLRDPMDNESDV